MTTTIVNQVEQERHARIAITEQMRHFFRLPSLPYLPPGPFTLVWHGQLDDRERRVLSVRLGLFGEPKSSLEKAGAVLGISGPRVSQISTRCFKRFKAALDADTGGTS